MLTFLELGQHKKEKNRIDDMIYSICQNVTILLRGRKSIEFQYNNDDDNCNPYGLYANIYPQAHVLFFQIIVLIVMLQEYKYSTV